LIFPAPSLYFAPVSWTNEPKTFPLLRKYNQAL
jgi:hypothetical protein